MNNKKKNGAKVFLFLLLGIGLLAGLIFQFAKVGNWFTPTYTLELRSANIGGIRVGASVMMAGIQIGRVDSIYLGEEGRYGVIIVKIQENYKIRSDAEFGMEQSGFLGDQHIFVRARGTVAPYFQDGDRSECNPPFSIAEIADSAKHLISTTDKTVGELGNIFGKLDQSMFTEETMNDLSEVIVNIKAITHNVDQVTASLNMGLLGTNGIVSKSVTNLISAISSLEGAAEQIETLISDNRAGIDSTITNSVAAMEKVNSILVRLQKSEGIIGALINDGGSKTNLQDTISDLSILINNLKKYGILSYYRKTKELREE